MRFSLRFVRQLFCLCTLFLCTAVPIFVCCWDFDLLAQHYAPTNQYLWEVLRGPTLFPWPLATPATWGTLSNVSLLWCTARSASGLTALVATAITCLKCLFVFLLIVLVRVTTPKFKMETLTKLGWLYSFTFILVIFFCYGAGFFFF